MELDKKKAEYQRNRYVYGNIQFPELKKEKKL